MASTLRYVALTGRTFHHAVFIAEITARAFIIADSNKRRTLSRADIAKALSKSDQFDFLIDIVPSEEPPGGAQGANAAGRVPKKGGAAPGNASAVSLPTTSPTPIRPVLTNIQTAQSRDDSQNGALEDGGANPEDVPGGVDLDQVPLSRLTSPLRDS